MTQGLAPLREEILAALAKFTGQKVPAAFIQHTERFLPGVDRFHTLFAGIYKPAWSQSALSIVTKETGPYADETIFLDDGRWLMRYKPRAGGLHISDNQALVKCMAEGLPLGVFKQIAGGKSGKGGSVYFVMGLGILSNYDAEKDEFILESADTAALAKVEGVLSTEDARYEFLLYSQLSNKFIPFVNEEARSYSVTAPKREEVFRTIVLKEYDSSCVVCLSKYKDADLVEAQAAHIIEKRARGTDDPRNGLSLCRTHHWAFDAGLFTVTDSYHVHLSPVTTQADTRNFSLLDMNGRPILLPGHESVRPHRDALEWHREHKLRI